MPQRSTCWWLSIWNGFEFAKWFCFEEPLSVSEDVGVVDISWCIIVGRDSLWSSNMRCIIVVRDSLWSCNMRCIIVVRDSLWSCNMRCIIVVRDSLWSCNMRCIIVVRDSLSVWDVLLLAETRCEAATWDVLLLPETRCEAATWDWGAKERARHARHTRQQKSRVLRASLSTTALRDEAASRTIRRWSSRWSRCKSTSIHSHNPALPIDSCL